MLFKQGEHLAVGIVGVHFSGHRRTPEWAVTSTLDDCKHGAETQFSIVLRQFHRVCVSERSLANKICPWVNAHVKQLAHSRDQFVLYSHQDRVPSKLTIGADNTPKEPINSTFLAGMLWLLCQETRLEQLELEFPLGHSHCDLDRFFSSVIVTWMSASSDVIFGRQCQTSTWMMTVAIESSLVWSEKKSDLLPSSQPR